VAPGNFIVQAEQIQMTDTSDPQSPGGANGSDGEAASGDPFIHAYAQYIKDLSFENPLAIEAVTGEDLSPQVNLDCSVASEKLADQTYEVVLSLEARAVRDEKTLFLISVDYAGLFSIENVSEDLLEPLLYVQCPTLLFPFARAVVGNVTKDGGYPPLLIDIIDFAMLYDHQLSEIKKSDSSEADGETAESEGAS
jgi:preprotein translocase subunit SecB